jgi:hypothetical protein
MPCIKFSDGGETQVLKEFSKGIFWKIILSAEV